MGHIIAFEWTSADGVFEADSMGEWFFPYDSLARRQLIKKTYEQADALLMGRTTYEMLAPYWAPLADDGQDGLAGVLRNTPKFIVSTGSEIADWGETTLIKTNAEAEITKLKEAKKLLIIGSAKLAESLARAGLIDEYKLLVQPFVMGTGRHFFSEGTKTALELAGVEKLEQGMLLIDYRVKK